MSHTTLHYFKDTNAKFSDKLQKISVQPEIFCRTELDFKMQVIKYRVSQIMHHFAENTHLIVTHDC